MIYQGLGIVINHRDYLEEEISEKWLTGVLIVKEHPVPSHIKSVVGNTTRSRAMAPFVMDTTPYLEAVPG